MLKHVRLRGAIVMTVFVLLISSCRSAGPAPTPVGQHNANGADAAPQVTASPLPTASNTDLVDASADEVVIRQGASAEAVITADVRAGYHVHSNPASDALFVATTLTLHGAKGISAGVPIYPAGTTKTFKFSDKPLSVYEGKVAIRLPLKSSAHGDLGAFSIPATLRYQACDNEACYPPKNLDLLISVVVN
jgi:Disulphide bond corrector protein DsbC